MLLDGYSVYDRKTLMYHKPFFEVSDGAAVRMVGDFANDANTMLGRHPADFVLFHVARFNDATGELLTVSPARHVTDLLPLVKRGKQDDLFANGSAGEAAVNSNGKEI